MVSMDAVVCGELVVHVNRAALMQYACHPLRQPANLLTDLATSVLEAGLVLV